MSYGIGERHCLRGNGSIGFKGAAAAFLAVLLMLGSLLVFNIDPAGADTGGRATRMVNGERGSLEEVYLDSGELTNLIFDEEQGLALSEEEHQVVEEFDSLDNAEGSENLIELTSGTEVQHFFRKDLRGIGVRGRFGRHPPLRWRLCRHRVRLFISDQGRYVPHEARPGREPSMDALLRRTVVGQRT
ncbi:MAG: hypothetical protein ACMUHU_03120 [Thermoplasmatota archaeon]